MTDKKRDSIRKDKKLKETKLVLPKYDLSEETLSKLTLPKLPLPKLSLFKSSSDPNHISNEEASFSVLAEAITQKNSFSESILPIENVSSDKELPLPIIRKIFNIKRIRSIYNRLHKQCPEVIDSNNIKMLSIGISKDISENLNIPIEHAIEFCIWYCGKLYKEKMIEGADRYNLKNETTGKVTIQEAEWATGVLDKRRTEETEENINIKAETKS